MNNELVRAVAECIQRDLETTCQCLIALQRVGYAVVPREPTEAMLEAGDDGYYGMSGDDVWKAMLAAAERDDG